MFVLTASVYNQKNEEKLITTKYYKKFENAFSDIIDKDSELCNFIKLETQDFNGSEPLYMGAASELGNGFLGDFSIQYPEGIVIYISEVTPEEDLDRIGGEHS